ncbi:Na+:solute symporter [bacterium]|nr:Na+:solute symporter [bacterium]
MNLSALDWTIIATYLVFALGVGLYFSRRASKNLGEYFISGRNLPWWIAGTSMVATTFAADTPLAITGMVAKNGIAGNWLWWNLAASHAMAVFFFSKLWRRANIVTDVELIEIRYSGKPAAFLRGFRALWEGVFLNAITLGWVTLAMTKIIDVLFDLSRWPTIHFLGADIDAKWQAIFLCLLIAFSYSILSGFWGVVATDFVQFIMAMSGTIILAIIATNESGGMDNIIQGLRDRFGDESGVLNFTPAIGSDLMPYMTFVAFISVNWWATKVVDGGGYIAQRMFSAKNEVHSFWATMWYAVAHYALRPWPWIVVALISLVIYPDLSDPEIGYPKAVLEFLPTGLKGMMIASFLAAFMSTIDTQLNWGASLVVNDFYKRFIKKNADDRHYVLASRISVALLMIYGSIFTYHMDSIFDAWGIFYAVTAGIGGVYITRWFWWRVNAFSEITAWISSAIIYLLVTQLFQVQEYGWILIYTALGSTACWITATLLTRPTDEKKLIEFYRRVRPGSPFWRPIARQATDVKVDGFGLLDIVLWLSGVVLIYGVLFAIGKWILGFYLSATVYSLLALLAGVFIFKQVNRG